MMKRLVTAIGVTTFVMAYAATPASAISVAAAGDIAKDPDRFDLATDYSGQIETAEQVNAMDPNKVIALGDLQYEGGWADDFKCNLTPTDSGFSEWPGTACGSYHKSELFGDAWGDFKGRTYPVPGSEEYQATSGTCPGVSCVYAKGYRSYWGYQDSDVLYYKQSIGTWTWYFLDAEYCEVTPNKCESGAGSGSQYKWLKDDIEASTPATCVGVAYHEPTFEDGGHQNGIMDDMYALADDEGGADLVLFASGHHYERFKKMAYDGTVGNQHPKPFLVGTGGNGIDHTPIDPATMQEVDGYGWGDAQMVLKAKGILRLTLRSTEYDYEFTANPTYSDHDDELNTQQCSNDPL